MGLPNLPKAIGLFILINGVCVLNAQTGVLDSTFNADGVHRFDFGFNENDNCVGSLVQVDGKIFSFGWTNSSITSNDIAVLRFSSDGSLDTDFGGDGYITFSENNNFESELAGDVAMQKDKKIILLGRKLTSGEDDVCLLRILPDGTPDSTFGQNGWVFTDLGSNFEAGLSVDIQTDQKIVVTANDDLFEPNLILLRYDPSGSLDTTFGEKGKAIHIYNSADYASEVLVQPDGLILTGGYTSDLNGSAFALWRFDVNGSADSLFGNSGFVQIEVSGDDLGVRGVAISVVEEGKIIMAGNVNNPNEINKHAAVVRILNNGQPDSSFNSTGIYILDLENDFEIAGMAIQKDGKILLAGHLTNLVGRTEWLLARLQPNGGLDTTFGENGLIVQPAEFGRAQAGGIALQQDNKIIVSGSSGLWPDLDFEIRRYDPGIVIPFQSNPISCSGLSNGSLSIHPQGGTPPYLFSLNDGPFQDDSIFNELPQGIYTITVKDALGLSGMIGPISVEDFVQPIVEVQIKENDIIIHVIEGGLPPYQYSIDGGVIFSNENIFMDLENGTYAIIVKDALDCVLDTSIVTILFLSLETFISSTRRIYPNPSAGNFTIEAKDLANQVVDMRLFDMAGKRMISRKYRISDSGNLPISISGLDQGMYLLSIETLGQVISEIIVLK